MFITRTWWTSLLYDECTACTLISLPAWNSRASYGFTVSETLTNLNGYCERMKTRFWPDWEECISHGFTTVPTKWITEHQIQPGRHTNFKQRRCNVVPSRYNKVVSRLIQSNLFITTYDITPKFVITTVWMERFLRTRWDR